MNRTIGVGVLSGVLGGLVLDGVMRVLSIHTPDGSTISIIGYLGTAIFPPDPWIGWLAYLLYGAVIGGMFAYIVGDRMIGERTAAFWGGVYGCGWWVVACAILLPALLGSCRSARMRAARCGRWPCRCLPATSCTAGYSAPPSVGSRGP